MPPESTLEAEAKGIEAPSWDAVQDLKTRQRVLLFVMPPALAVAKRNELPEVVIDPKSRRQFTRGKLLGKGGYAECYEFVDKRTNVVYAGKVVSKQRSGPQGAKEYTKEEINIHRTLHHKHIVRFHSHFEDDTYAYIILELCRGQSLKDMLQCRKVLTEADVRCFLRQLLFACEYLSKKWVIHRDLKPGNLLLTEDMVLKVADFGIATRVRYPGELKKKIAGTINFMAPEILTKAGYSYEADLWSVGCIMYTLLVGYPPFKSASFRETCSRIRNNEYHVPSTVSKDARALIQSILHPEPTMRPTITDIMQHDFLTKGFLPAHLPVSRESTQLQSTQDAADRKTYGEKRNLC